MTNTQECRIECIHIHRKMLGNFCPINNLKFHILIVEESECRTLNVVDTDEST